MAVPVRAGQHHLALSYFPARLLPGLAVAMLALALLILRLAALTPQVRAANFPALRWTTSLPTCRSLVLLLPPARSACHLSGREPAGRKRITLINGDRVRVRLSFPGDPHARHSVKFSSWSLLFVSSTSRGLHLPVGRDAATTSTTGRGLVRLMEMLSFTITLAIGLVYVWRKGALAVEPVSKLNIVNYPEATFPESQRLAPGFGREQRPGDAHAPRRVAGCSRRRSPARWGGRGRIESSSIRSSPPAADGST